MKYLRLSDNRVFTLNMTIMVDNPRPEAPFVIKEFEISKNGNLFGVGYYTFKGRRMFFDKLFLASRGQFIEFIETR